MNTKLQGWKTNCLSIAGWATLINSVLATIPTYSMQINIRPAKISKNIDQIQRNFLWGSTTEKKRIHHANWNLVTTQKSKGGLGLHRAKQKNGALIFGLAWRLKKNQDKPWAQVLKAKYGRIVI